MQSIATSNYHISSSRDDLVSQFLSHTIAAAAAFTISAMFVVWILHGRPAAAPDSHEARAVAHASNPYGALFDPRIISGPTPFSLAQSSPLKSTFTSLPPSSAAIAKLEDVAPKLEDVAPMPPPSVPRLGESVPMPIPRPAELGSLGSPNRLPASGRRFAQHYRMAAASAVPQDNRTFFEKLFGLTQTPEHVLAYAAPEDSNFGNPRGIAPGLSSRYDRSTAVYDIAAHTVYMPNGTRLEAHSGLGQRLDDPRYVSERMRGATPPSVYELRPREQLFHGVQALRLIPTGNAGVYGRTGLLAHTYMLGPNGDSNGCVSFKNYNAFLQAYQNGEIKRLAVVTRLN